MKSLFLLILLLASAIAIPAADRPNLSGEWKANLEKSDFGPAPPPDSFVRKIAHTEPSITFEDLQETQVGPNNTTRKYSTDGKEMTFSSQGVDVKSAASWEGKTLVVKSHIDDMSIKVSEVITVAEDGKTMNSVVKYSTPQGDIEIKLLFVKK